MNPVIGQKVSRPGAALWPGEESRVLPPAPGSAGEANSVGHIGPGSRTRLHWQAKERLLSVPHEPLFIADWERALMIHYEVNSNLLQKYVPYDLDLESGRAFVSVVAFTMHGMRFRFFGRFGALLLKPIATHEFLNVRTYIRHRGEAGIYFMTEWLSNPLSRVFGPVTFGLPYRLGTLEYKHDWQTEALSGSVTAHRKRYAYTAALAAADTFCECAAGSLPEWLMERYTAFTWRRGQGRFFRVWHRPWLQVAAEPVVSDQSLLEQAWPFFRSAKISGGNFSPGLQSVWMGWPHPSKRAELNSVAGCL